MSGLLLSMRDLHVTFGSRDGEVPVLRGIDLDVASGEVVAIVGESGSGKSTVINAAVGLLDASARVSGSVELLGVDLLTLRGERLRRVRGAQIGLVFQDPMGALNPSHRIGRQVAEAILAHQAIGRAAARARAIGLLGEVGLPQPAVTMRQYPHELSGGMRQRATIAIALACDPPLVLADEPTTALDSTIQAQILDLLAELRDRRGTAMVLVSHDLSVVAEIAQRIVVMYAGQVVESGPTDAMLTAPRHPYTRGLLAASPRLDGLRRTRMETIPGAAPKPAAVGEGCAFRMRCPLAAPECAAPQELLTQGHGRQARCWRAEETHERAIAWGAAR